MIDDKRIADNKAIEDKRLKDIADAELKAKKDIELKAKEEADRLTKAQNNSKTVETNVETIKEPNTTKVEDKKQTVSPVKNKVEFQSSVNVTKKPFAESSSELDEDIDDEIIAMRAELKGIRDEIVRLKKLKTTKESNANGTSTSKAAPSALLKKLRRTSMTSPGDSSLTNSTEPSTDDAVAPIKTPIRRASVATTSTVSESNNSATTVTSKDEPAALPEGWKEMVDKTSGRTYYVNKNTKERQWKRPAPAAPVVELPAVLDDSEKVEIKPVQRFSRRLNASESEELTRQLGRRPTVEHRAIPEHLLGRTKAMIASAGAETVLNDGSRSNREAKVQKRRESIVTAFAEPSAAGKLTIGQMEQVGAIKKTGFLMKQSKLLGRYVNFLIYLVNY